MKTVAVIVGSLSAQSINRKLAQAIVKAGEGHLAFRFVEIGDLPLYNRDLDADMPDAAHRFKGEIEAADAVLIVAPEYNRSVPAAVKNAIEWGSRPYGKNSFAGKPAATAGAAGGNISTAVGQYHLRGILTHLGMVVLPHPEMFIKFHPDAYGAHGAAEDDALAKLLGSFTQAFAAWIDKVG